MNFTPPYLSTITARTLIVHGDRDPLYPINMAVELYSSIPYSYLWIIPNSGHGSIFGEMADRFTKTALAFLSDEWTARDVKRRPDQSLQPTAGCCAAKLKDDL
jgi:pimeloyl-ACP methyl ester carboxylesterase